MFVIGRTINGFMLIIANYIEPFHVIGYYFRLRYHICPLFSDSPSPLWQQLLQSASVSTKDVFYVLSIVQHRLVVDW